MSIITHYKRWFIGVAFIFAAFWLLHLFFSFRSVYATLNDIRVAGNTEGHTNQTGDGTLYLNKDILWLEQYLELSKSDSINMTVNLRDSVVQIVLKGKDLYNAKIIKKYPSGFLFTNNRTLYHTYATISPIISETSNISKKDIKKKRITDSGKNEMDAKIKKRVKKVSWQFTTENGMKITIMGINDNAGNLIFILQAWELIKDRIPGMFTNPLPGRYQPVLYLWLNNHDAETIYKAVPVNGEILFRN